MGTYQRGIQQQEPVLTDTKLSGAPRDELFLTTLGSFQLRLGLMHARLANIKDRALTAYLAIDETPHPRDRLAHLLWPTAARHRALHSLSQAVYRLRRTGLPIASPSPRTLSLRIGTDFHTTWSTSRLDEAIANLVDTAFLQDVVIDSEPFQEWKAERESALQRTLLTKAHSMIRGLYRSGHFASIIANTTSLIDRPALYPSLFRYRCRAIAIVLGPAAALKEIRYGTTADPRLRASKQLHRLAQRLESLARTPFEPPIRLIGSEKRPPSSQRQRAELFRSLYEDYHTAARESGVVSVVVGATGTGTHWLVDRLARAAAVEGATVVAISFPKPTPGRQVVSMTERGTAEPLVPFTRCGEGRCVRLSLPTSPKVLTRSTHIDSPMTLDIEKSHHRRAWGPHTVVVVENVQWMDEESSRYFLQLLRRLSGLRMYMVMTIDFKNDRRQPVCVTQFVKTLEMVGARWLNIDHSSATEAEEMVAAMGERAGRAMSANAKRALLTLSGKNADKFHQLLPSPDHPQSESHTMLTQNDGLPSALLTSLEGYWSDQESRVRHVMRAIAILRTHASLANVIAVSKMSEPEVCDATAELVRTCILDDYDGRLQFSHYGVQDVVLRLMPRHIRRELHARAAVVLEEDCKEVDDLALHYFEAGQLSKSLDLSAAKARRASAAGDISRADYFWRLALACERRVERTGFGVSLAYAEFLARVGDLAGSARLLRDRTAEARCDSVSATSIDHSPKLALARAGVHMRKQIQDALVPARDISATALCSAPAVRRGSSWRQEVELVGCALENAYDTGQHDIVQRAKDQLRTVADRSNDPVSIVEALAMLARIECIEGRIWLAERDALTAVERATVAEDWLGQLIGLSALATVRYMNGKLNEARLLIDRADGLARDPLLETWRQRLRFERALIEVDAGSWQAAGEKLRKSIEELPQHYQLFVLANSLGLSADCKDMERVSELAALLRQQNRKVAAAWPIPVEAAFAGLAALSKGNRSAADQFASIVGRWGHLRMVNVGDPTYTEIFIGRYAAIRGGAAAGIASLATALEGIGTKRPLAWCRVALEMAEMAVGLNSDMAWRLSRDAFAAANHAGAGWLAEQAFSIMDEVRAG